MVFLGTITQILIGVALGEIAGQLIFYRFKFGWKVILSFCLTSFVIWMVLVLAVQIIRETSTQLYLLQSTSGVIGGSFFFWTFFRMKKKMEKLWSY